jgi:hypothetical protein
MNEASILDEIKRTIESLDYGSVEVIVQDGKVTQISTRIIRKTNIKNDKEVSKNIQKAPTGGINVNFKY